MQSSFDIARTPTLEAVANEDQLVLAQDLRVRVDESLKMAEAQPEVVEAAEGRVAADERLEKLRSAQRVLNLFAKSARERMENGTQTAIDKLVEAAGFKGTPEFGKLNELVALEQHSRLASRALEQIAEHRIPLAQIASLRADSHGLLAMARAVTRVAQDRAESLLTRMRDAVTEEMVLPVDLSKGVVGALLAHADGCKRRSIQISEEADEMERSYARRVQGKEGRQ